MRNPKGTDLWIPAEKPASFRAHRWLVPVEEISPAWFRILRTHSASNTRSAGIEILVQYRGFHSKLSVGLKVSTAYFNFSYS